MSYGLGGPVNNGPGYYPLDKNDWAPALGARLQSGRRLVLEKIFGKGSVFRAGGAMVYDHYGTAMAQALASGGSPGLATSVAQPVNTNFTTSFRYTGNGYPTLPTSQAVRSRYARRDHRRLHHLQRRFQHPESAL